jgi:ribosomal protein S18 acetylase RimI-like enzyme
LDTIANTTNIARTISFEVGRIDVRAVTEDEIHCVADIITHSFHFDRGWRAWFTPLFRLGIAEDLRHRIRSSNASSNRERSSQQICSIALYEHLGRSQVVGTVEIGTRNGNDRQKQHRYVYISNLAVSKEFRRRGVGIELLLDCERSAQSWGYTEIHLHVMADNERGLNLYQKLGYHVVSTEFLWAWFPWWNRPERLFMCKELVASE